MSDKLPEWPEKPHDVHGTSHDWLNYHALVSYAALARMEALVEYAREARCEHMHHAKRDQHAFGEVCPVIQRLHELLAACERRKS